jgi:hypothetical protein
MLTNPRPRRRRARPLGASTTAALTAFVAAGAIATVAFFIGRATAPRPDAQSADGAGPGSAPSAESPARSTSSPEAPAPAGTGAPPLFSAPPLAFEPDTLDFGMVPPNTPMSGKVRITNVADLPVRIAAMRPSCTCTTVEDLTGRTIAPGESVELTPVVEGLASAGERKSEVRFRVHGYDEQISYFIRGVVTRSVRADPANFEMPAEGAPFRGTVRVTSIDGAPFTILSAGGAPPDYADGFAPGHDEPRNAYDIRWDMTGFDPANCLDASGNRMPIWWVIETDHPGAPVVVLHVRHVVCAMPELPREGQAWVLSELHTVIDRIDPGGSAEVDVVMKFLRGLPPTDTARAVTSESKAFRAELVGRTRGEDRITFRIRITPAADVRGVFVGDLRIHSVKGYSRSIAVIGRVADAPARTAAAAAP